jgi:hypothetical protein
MTICALALPLSFCMGKSYFSVFGKACGKLGSQVMTADQAKKVGVWHSLLNSALQKITLNETIYHDVSFL